MRVSDGGGRPAGGVSGAELQQCHRVAARGAAEAVAAPALEGGWDDNILRIRIKVKFFICKHSKSLYDGCYFSSLSWFPVFLKPFGDF